MTWTPVDPDRSADHGHANSLLAALPPGEWTALAAGMEGRIADVGDSVYEAGEPAEAVYFPVTSVVSLLTTLSDGRAIETATVGREGMAGLFVFLGDERSVNGRAVVQMPGELLRVDVKTFRAAVVEGSRLRVLLMDWTRAMLLQISQGVACGVAHSAGQRLSRWLLQTLERTGSATIQLTHQFLADILGVRRATITEEIGRLQAAGALSSARGAITIEDHASLERATCECYAIVRREYARLLPVSRT